MVPPRCKQLTHKSCERTGAVHLVYSLGTALHAVQLRCFSGFRWVTGHPKRDAGHICVASWEAQMPFQRRVQALVAALVAALLAQLSSITLPAVSPARKFDTNSTRSRKLPPPITTTNPLFPAPFEQTQRVPTGHPDVCLCDVSGATNYIDFIRYNTI